MAGTETPRYRLTPKAEADLEQIWLYTAQEWSPDQADRYLDGLLETLDILADMPTLARERTEFVPPVRIHPSAGHLIVFRVGGDRIQVVWILGGRQDWRALLDRIDP